ncbi:uncharacterized protein BDV17DRAFT_264650 [Aspergillus undulatus]|uniref:uncharacterized protein n=1 Tax=Aspergillus undulatus TaxID=1810928 RepID=UPI003CCCA820
MRPLIWPRGARPDMYHLPNLYDLVCSAKAPCPMGTSENAVRYERHQTPVFFEGSLRDNLRSLVSGLCQDSTGLCQEYAQNL